jgi:hypothetical protein
MVNATTLCEETRRGKGWDGKMFNFVWVCAILSNQSFTGRQSISPMRRRPFLSTAALATLAGCSTGSDADGQTAEGAGGFELIDIEAPNRVPSTAKVRFTIRVRNASSERQTFSSPIELQTPAGEWRTVDTVSLSLDAGETGDVQTAQLAMPYLGTRKYRLPALDETWAVEVRPLQLSFGESYLVPNGLIVSVIGGKFEPEYPIANSSANQTSTPTPTTPSDGNLWLIMRVDVRNRLQDETLQAPEPSQFSLGTKGIQRQLRQEVAVDPYEGGPLDSRDVRQGSLVYAVPPDIQATDVTMAWAASLSEGNVKAVWSSSADG